MKSATAILMLILAAAAPANCFDIGTIVNNSRPADNFKIIDVDGLTRLMSDPASHLNIYDANGWGLRSTAGVIPGAHLLSSAENYDVPSSLPSDKSAKLVFYCADPH